MGNYSQNLLCYGPGTGMMGATSWGIGLGFFGLFLNLAIWVLIIWGTVTIIRHFSSQNLVEKRPDPALEVLRERYANGDITKEEYEQKRKDLID